MDSQVLSLLLRIEVPFEIWIVLVILTGGIWLLIVAIPQSNPAPDSDHVTERRATSSLDPEVLQIIMVAMLRGEDASNLATLFQRHSIDTKAAATLIHLSQSALNVMLADEFAEKDVGEKIELLEKEGIPTELAKILLLLVVRACADAAAKDADSHDGKSGVADLTET